MQETKQPKITSKNVLDGFHSHSNTTRQHMTGSDFPNATYGTTEPLTQEDHGIQVSSEENLKATIIEVRDRKQQEKQSDTNRNIGLVSLCLIILIIIGFKSKSILDYLNAFMPSRSYALSDAAPTNTLHINSVADELIKLRDLRDQGILTPEEFERQKNNLLS